jgi:ABC-type uncharacterized transport system permease subunit
MRAIYAAASVASLAVCLAVPFLYVGQSLSEQAFKTTLLAASLAWFVFATLWISRRSG